MDKQILGRRKSLVVKRNPIYHSLEVNKEQTEKHRKRTVSKTISAGNTEAENSPMRPVTPNGHGLVKYMFRASSGLEITVLKGERVQLMEPDPGDGWTKIQTIGGGAGFIPTSYLNIDENSSSSTVNTTSL